MSDTNLLLDKLSSKSGRQTDDPVRCPVCCASEVSRLFAIDIFDGPPSFATIPAKRHIYRCTNCSHAFAHPHQGAELASYYQNLPEEYHSIHDSNVNRYRMVLSVLDLPRTRRILDWGCGTGTFLSLVPDTVAKFGVEPARRAAETAERAGIRMLSSDSLRSSEWSKSFDAVTVIDVVEHLSELQPVLATASHLLRPGGRLVFLTGDFDSWSAKKAGRYWYYLHYAEHLSFFSRPSMKKWLERNFDQIAISTVTHHPLSIAARAILWARFRAATCLERLELARKLHVSAKRFVTSDHMLVSAIRKVG